ncbi:MAG: NAD-dependent deacylase [Bacteroidetes bacterium]|nr:MAG: NAD-dependent deacylase [Bacteroidota bacterium]
MKKLVVLSGAGMSADSGIQTFRDSNGLWENYRIEEVATPQAWNSNPEMVQEFYNMRRANVMEASPNAAHLFLAELEQTFDVHVVTQNIDDLHERAGSSKVLHLHGNIRLAKSSGPEPEKKYYPINGPSLSLTEDFCDDGYPLRPHVVWFGEAVPALDEAGRVCAGADILLIIGTSLQVYPAAGLVHYAPPGSSKIVVDPGAKDLGLDSSFTQINSGAVSALEDLREILHRLNQ